MQTTEQLLALIGELTKLYEKSKGDKKEDVLRFYAKYLQHEDELLALSRWAITAKAAIESDQHGELCSSTISDYPGSGTYSAPCDCEIQKAFSSFPSIQ
jgi:hypothetical protein